MKQQKKNGVEYKDSVSIMKNQQNEYICGLNYGPTIKMMCFPYSARLSDLWIFAIDET